jgi:hypothetical protein
MGHDPGLDEDVVGKQPLGQIVGAQQALELLSPPPLQIGIAIGKRILTSWNAVAYPGAFRTRTPRTIKRFMAGLRAKPAA